MLTSMKQLLRLSVAALFAGSLMNCSSQPEPTEEPVAAEEGTPDEAAEAPAAPATPAPVAEKPATPAPVPETTNGAAVPPASAAAGPASGDQVVYYVKAVSVQAHAKPEAKSPVAGKFVKGDHFLATVEGDWARLSDGRYVPMKALSDKAVGRTARAAQWGTAK